MAVSIVGFFLPYLSVPFSLITLPGLWRRSAHWKIEVRAATVPHKIPGSTTVRTRRAAYGSVFYTPFKVYLRIRRCHLEAAKPVHEDQADYYHVYLVSEVKTADIILAAHT